MIEDRRRAIDRRNGAIWLVPLALLALAGQPAWAQDAEAASNALEQIDYSVLPGNRLEFRFDLAQPIEQPQTFSIKEPARIALDLPDTRNATGKRSMTIGVGVAESVDVAEARGRTRVVVNLSEVPQYRTRVEGSSVVLTFGGRRAEAPEEAERKAEAEEAPGKPGKPFTAERAAAAAEQYGVEDVNFRRGGRGQGRVIVDLSSEDVPVNIEREAGTIVVELLGTHIPKELRKRFDVLDFATPVKFVDVMQRGRTGRIHITPRTQDYEQIAYQSAKRVTVELKPLTKEELAEREEEKKQYTGEKLSLNFQDIEVRSVLQLLADFTGLNVVVSDSVTGTLTLRLKNVPWDQALDIILQTEGLAKRRNGNVIFIAPQQEIAQREQQRLEAEQKEQQLAPLRSEYIQVNYAKAAKLASILQAEDTNLLSERASVTVDERTNTLLVRATADNLEEARRLVTRLDVPVRQVLIESRIVVATDDFNREIGVRWGFQRDTTNDDDGIVVSAGSDGVDELIDDEELTDRFNVNLPVTDPAGSIGLAVAELPIGELLELELSAMEAEGRGEIISSPRVLTSDQSEARIEQGVEIPFQEASASGATSVSFKDAVLSLTVTPQITPDDRIIMDLAVTRDSVGEVFNGVPSVDTREVQTQVLVDDGETLVLGGIYEQMKNDQVNRVPFFGELPGIGWLFKQTIRENDKSELLVFVTPKIVKDGSAAQF